MSIFSSLRREQKEAVGLLSIGTFLEYFDLMLYVHMAVLLNELFFPKTDARIASLLAAFAFCSTYALRPIGALIFGYIGDHIGRKFTLVITTTLMAISCVIMANLPTYAQIGVAAAVIITICRIAQGMSSMGEIIGAELYITESIKPPQQYPAVSIVNLSATIGSTSAIGIATIVTSFGMNWRMAFWIGSLVALIGIVARTTLRETPDFVDAKRRLKNHMALTNSNPELLKESQPWQQTTPKKTSIALFLIKCAWPASFYFTYIYCGNLLKSKFGYAPEQVIQHNFMVGLMHLLGECTIVLLSFRIYPLLILRVKLIIFFIVVIIAPYALSNVATPHQLLMLQAFLVLAPIDNVPAIPIFFRHLAITQRFTYAGFTYALSRLVMHFTTAFGLVYLTSWFGNYGLWCIMIPVTSAYLFGLCHFAKLEKESGHYPQKKIV